MYLDDFFNNAPHIEINQLSCDSRLPMKDAIFFCVEGIKYNGHEFVEEAIKNGAKVIIYDEEINTSSNAIFIKVKNVLDVCAKIASKFYGNPAHDMTNYVITGCYGKSITAYLLKALLQNYKNTGSIGYLGINYNDESYLIGSDTLNIIDNQRYLAKFKNSNVTSCIFESSVINLSYKKLSGVNPKAVIYTSTGLDSNEYIVLNNDYERELVRYFESLSNDCLLVLNADDVLYESIISKISNKHLSYGFNETADIRIENVSLFANHSTFTLRDKNGEHHLNVNLVGLSSIYNLTACLASLSLEHSLDELIKNVERIKPNEGNMEPIVLNQSYNLLVDSAKNLDSVEEVLKWAKKVTPRSRRILSLLTLDYTDNEANAKELALMADKYSDLIVFAPGDSYGKDLTPILKCALSFVKENKALFIQDRIVAIESIIELANNLDTVLILGKGRQKYLYSAFEKENYEGDSNIACKYILKRMEEENETL